MKIKALVAALSLSAVLLAGCSSQPAQKPADKGAEKPADVVASASVVDNAADFEKAISKDGKWIICTTKDIVSDKELVVDGEFKNGKKDDKGNETYQRKVALYTQDDKHKVTGKFSLTAPKITFNSPYGSLEHGTFKGDVYVAGKNFKLVNQTIEGNLYFLNQEAKDTFTIKDKEDDTKTVITGVQELKTN